MINSFQKSVKHWMLKCFGLEVSNDIKERNHRFLEESLELVQAAYCTKSEAHQLVEYVFNRPVGDLDQEVGGVMVTLAAFCSAHGANMQHCGLVELDRAYLNMDKIREKQKMKPKFSALPDDDMTAAVDAAMVAMKNISPPLRRSECQRLINAALSSYRPTAVKGTVDLYNALRNMHWNDMKLAVINAKDLPLGIETYSDELLDKAIIKYTKD